MKNTLGGQFYLFQARRGGPTRVRPTPQSAIRYMGPGAMSSIGWDSTITMDFALTLDFVPYILQGAITSNLPGGVEAHRLLSFEREQVAFRWRDYAHGNYRRK